MSGGRRIVTVAGCVAALAGAGAASVHAAGPPAALPPALPPGLQKLSDERLQTAWAYPARRSIVRSRPAKAARRVAQLHFFTEDRFPELYVVLARWVDPAGRPWLRIRVPMRPNGRTGWVPESALDTPTVVHKMVEVDRRKLRLRVFDNGRVVFRARVGIGAPGTPTPAGRFYIREKFHVHGVPLYGTHAIGTSAYAPTLSDWPGGGVVGLHGTNQPQLIPGRPSHGCIRLRNADVARLYRLVTRGTPIRIV